VLAAASALFSSEIFEIFDDKQQTPEVVDALELPFEREKVQSGLEKLANYKDTILIDDNETKVLERLPTYFQNTSLNQDYDWFRIRGTNKSEDRLSVTVKAITSDATILRLDGMDTWKFTVDPNEELDKLLRPKYEFFGKHSTDSNPVEVDISIDVRKNQSADSLFVNNYTVRVLSPTEFIWNLKNIDGVELGKSTVVNSLGVWAATKTPNTSQLALELLSRHKSSALQGGNTDIFELWLRELYENYLLGATIRTRPFLLEMNLKNSIRIGRPEDVLDDLQNKRPVHALDLGLLIGSLSSSIYKHHKTSVSLLVMKNTSDSIGHYILWPKNDKTDRWNAVNLLNVSLPFSENMESSAKQVQKFVSNKALARQLFEDGSVAIPTKILALNYNRSIQLLGGAGLP
jgi:hypothetical protein